MIPLPHIENSYATIYLAFRLPPTTPVTALPKSTTSLSKRTTGMNIVHNIFLVVRQACVRRKP
jgi:hypothetical protein